MHTTTAALHEYKVYDYRNSTAKARAGMIQRTQACNYLHTYD